MKKHLLLGLAIAGAALGSAHAQSFSAPANQPKKPAPERPVAPVRQRPPVGALPRATRGNPIQMINPRAPKKYYGTPDETVTYDPNNPSHVTGIILFGIRW